MCLRSRSPTRGQTAAWSQKRSRTSTQGRHCESWSRKGMRRRCWPVRVRSTSQSQRGELGHPTSQAPAPGPHASVPLSGCCIRVSSACASHRLGWLLWERVKLSGRQAASSWTSRRSWVSAAATLGSCASFAEAQMAALLLLEGNKAAEEWTTGVSYVESALLDGGICRDSS